MTKVPEISWLKDILKAIEKIEKHPRYADGRLSCQTSGQKLFFIII